MRKLKQKALSILLVLLLVMGQSAVFADAVVPTQTEVTPIDAGLDYLKLMIDYSKANYYKDLPDDQILEAIYKGLYKSMDEHSVYYTPKEYQSFSENINGTYEGVGISVTSEGDYIRVAKPLTGGPAIKAGILIGDIIVSVDGVDIKGFGLERVVTLIKGPAGTKVKLGITRTGASGVIYFDLSREKINVSPISTKVLDGNVGYILLEQFSSDSSAYVNGALGEFKSKGIQKVVIDVRNNPGGSLDQVVNIVDYFAPKGSTIVKVDYKVQEDKDYVAQIDPYQFKLAVLANENSASASEIFAAAIKELKLGTLIGINTYGKGTVQNLLPISNGGAIKMTVAEYFSALGNPVDKVGVKPMIEVKPLVVTFEDVIRNFAPMYSLDTFKRGSKSLDVKGMQQRLQYLGFTFAKIDGIFGLATETQLKAFEKKHGITVDGILDEATKKKIDEVLKANLKPAEDVQLKKALEILK
jgi:carboxyl-terminal processing protease